MNFHQLEKQIDLLKKTLQNAGGRASTEKVVLEKKVLTEKEFYAEDFMRGYRECHSHEDIQVGDFVRYKKMDQNKTTYLWGGVVTFVCPAYIRLKNVYTGAKWSVQLANPDVRHVFYVRSKMTKEDQDTFSNLDGGNYVNLDTASIEGLLAAVLAKGGERDIIAWARELTKMNESTYAFE